MHQLALFCLRRKCSFNEVPMKYSLLKVTIPVVVVIGSMTLQGAAANAGCDCKCKDASGVEHLGDKLNAPDLKDLAKRCREVCKYSYDQPMQPIGTCMNPEPSEKSMPVGVQPHN
jgi:hypothetical protein